MSATVTVNVLRKADLKDWGLFPDLVVMTKMIQEPIEEAEVREILEKDEEYYVLEFIGGTDRGAFINVWERMPKDGKNLDHVWAPSDDRSMRKADEIHFGYFVNAKEEWEALTTVSAIIDIMERNG